MRPTFHLAPAQAWANHDPSSQIRPPSLAAEGFVHCTDGVAEMIATANRHYLTDLRDFVVLTIDLDATGSPWRSDDPGRIYPHIFGPIDPVAILSAVPITRAADGTFIGFDADSPEASTPPS